MLYILSSARNKLTAVLCVFARCPSMVLVAASTLTKPTLVISARNLRQPRLIFLLVLTMQT